MAAHIKPPTNDPSFKTFYLRSVANSEGCGCAEAVIRDGTPPIRKGDSIGEIFAALRERLRRTR